jgi:L-lactate dehydrogenase complex protein LldF
MAAAKTPISQLVRQARLSLPIVQTIGDGSAAPNVSDLPDFEKLRSLAGEIRRHTLDHLDHYLAQMRAAVEKNNGHFHLAATAGDGRQRLIETLAREKCTQVRCEPSLLCDEIGYGAPGIEGLPEAMVTGANFAIAETGQICLCRDAAPVWPPPRVIVCVLGIESILPRLADLAIMLKLLARSSIGRPMTVTTELLGASSALHVIFVDNGRRKILAGEHRQVLRCIGCGACSAVCPVYQQLRKDQNIGPASPIAAIMSPLMKGLKQYDQLPFASTLCGACSQACPVGIDLPWHLLRLRQQLVESRRTGIRDRLSHRFRSRALLSESRYRKRSSLRWKLDLPADAPEPAARSFHELWKLRRADPNPD